ncbi:MAG: hypothetical protein ACFE68_07930 [Candidatus Hodarchaeota archaeon]
MEEKIWITAGEPRRKMPTGVKNFDSFFKILSGACTVFYVENQTYSDPHSLLAAWSTNCAEDEYGIIINTYDDPVRLAEKFQNLNPEIVEKTIKLSKEDRFFWIDMFTYRGFTDVEAEKLWVDYKLALESFGINFSSYFSVKKPSDFGSIHGLNPALNNILERTGGEKKARIVVSYGDDLVDLVGEDEFLKFYRRQINTIIHKFNNTAIYLFSYMGHSQRFHATLERLSDSVIRWGWGRVGKRAQEEKFLEILKSPLPDFYLGKIRYKLNKKMLAVLPSSKITNLSS